MKNYKKIVLVLLVLLATGCTKYKTYNKQPITFNETGQRVVENILCKTDDTVSQYEKLKESKLNELEQKFTANEISEQDYNNEKEQIERLFNIDNVDQCQEYKVFKGDEGLWTTLFVKTLAWLIIKIGTLTKNYGWAIIIVTLLIRLALYPLTKKTAMQSENMKKAQSKLQKLEEKYRNRTDQESQMMKAQETMKIYKENNINPMAGCLFAFIQIPLFFAFYEALYRLPVVLEEQFLSINLGITPLTAMQQGKYYYLIFIVLIVAATYFSFKLNTSTNLAGEQAKQMKMMSNMSIIMISIASLSISTGIALYWIINSSFTIVQNLLAKRSVKNDHIA